LGNIVLASAEERNALGRRDHLALSKCLGQWSRSADLYAAIIRSTVRGVFSIGTDLGEMAEQIDLKQTTSSAVAGATSAATIGDFSAPLYQLYWQLECFMKPTVSCIDGHCAGAGNGLVMSCTHRVGGAEFRMAFPEVGLGLSPQAGAIHWLSRLPEGIGLYLALSARGVSRADALALGLLTHTIDGRALDDLTRRLENAEPIDPILDGLQRDPGPRDLDLFQGLIARCFSAPTVEEIVERLMAENSALKPWAERVVRDILRNSPIALKATHRLISGARTRDLRETLIETHTVFSNLVVGADFREGLRAAVIDKDRSPRWRRSALSDISQKDVDAVFTPPDGQRLSLPARDELQFQRI
jgi:enoyl-CoA hydratase